MSAISKTETAFLQTHGCIAPTYAQLNGVEIIDANTDTKAVQFNLQFKNMAGHVFGYLTCTVLAVSERGEYWVNSIGGNNPEYDEPVYFDSLSVSEKTLPIVTDHDSIFAVNCLQFQLTQEQCRMLNDDLKEYCEEQFKAASEKESAAIQDLADESRYYEKMGN